MLSRTLGLLACGALLLSWLAPNHYPPWTSFHNEAAAFAALLACCLAALVQGSAHARVGGKAPLLFLGLALLVALQWWRGQILFGGDALVSGLYLTGMAGAWWAGASLTSNKDHKSASLKLFASVVVAGALASVLIAALQWLRLESSWGIFAADRGPDMRPYGNLGQPNHLATLALTGLVMACLLRVQRSLKAWHLIALITWLSFGLVLTESRSGQLSALLLGALLFWQGRPSWGLGGRKAILVWWLALATTFYVWAPLNEVLLLQPARDASIASDSLRMTMWRQCVAAILESPWAGYGWRQTVVGQKVGAEAIPGTLPTEYAHNIALDVLMWIGIPLGVVLLALVAWWLVKSFKKCDGPVQLLLWAGVVPFAVHSLVEFPFAYAYFLFPVGWMLGSLVVRQSAAPVPGTHRLSRPTWWATAAGIVVFGVLCIQVAWEYLKIEEDYRVMRFELRSVGKPPLDYVAPQITLLTQLDETLKVGRLVPYPGMPARDIERLRRANASQAWATLHLSYAVALALNDQPEEATRQLRNLRALYGQKTYKQSLDHFLQLQTKQYPQLALVQLP